MKKRKVSSPDMKVSSAREHLKVARDKLLADHTEEEEEEDNVEVMKEELCTAYTEAREEALMKKIRSMEKAVYGSRCKESWTTVYKITG